MAESGASVVSLGTGHRLDQVKSLYPTLCFQGNVNHELLAHGTVEQVRAATQTCLREGGGRRHVLNLNHGVERHTPVENFAAFVRAAAHRNN
jgi:uroporphyrinogen decarboxylase